MSLVSFFHYWKELFRFRSIDPNQRSIVFYAEDTGSWKYFEPIIDELLNTHGKSICYVTSSPLDPVLLMGDPRINAFSIGSGLVRALWFMYMQADVVVMTLPDLETMVVKRSRHRVHYVYVYHSMVSSHMAYRQTAFDYYDAILCVGPHHRDEIRASEELYGLKPKTLINAGYSLLDSIIASKDPMPDISPRAEGNGKRVLIAPSWGEHGLIETCAEELIQVLLDAGHQVTVRPHTMTMRHNTRLVNELWKQFSSNSKFHLDIDLRSQGNVIPTEIMITDWSGAALEYAFGLERPVLFIDMPKKINNPQYNQLSHVPIEVRLRSEIGEIVSPDKLYQVPSVLDRLYENPVVWKERLRKLRSQWIYNIGRSKEISAAYIAEIATSSAKLRSHSEYHSGEP